MIARCSSWESIRWLARELGTGGGREVAAPEGADSQNDRVDALRRWFTEPGAVVMAAGTARQFGVATGQRFEVDVGGVSHPARLISQIHDESAAFHDALILTDIAQAQEWLGQVGRLSRIDLRVPSGAAGDALLARLRTGLPPDVQVQDAQGSRTRQSLDMTGAFTTNLKAMSMLALMVSTLLIYGAISFAVVQRRRVIGILASPGGYLRSEVLTIVAFRGGGAGRGIGRGSGVGCWGWRSGASWSRWCRERLTICISW